MVSLLLAVSKKQQHSRSSLTLSQLLAWKAEAREFIAASFEVIKFNFSLAFLFFFGCKPFPGNNFKSEGEETDQNLHVSKSQCIAEANLNFRRLKLTLRLFDANCHFWSFLKRPSFVVAFCYNNKGREEKKIASKQTNYELLKDLSQYLSCFLCCFWKLLSLPLTHSRLWPWQM